MSTTTTENGQPQTYRFEMERPTIEFEVSSSIPGEDSTVHVLSVIEAQLIIEDCMRDTKDINAYWEILRDRLKNEMGAEFQTKDQVWQVVTVTFAVYKSFKKKFNDRLRQLTGLDSTPSE